MLKSLEQLDRWIADRFRGWSSRLSGGEHPKEVLEIRKEILTGVRDKVEAVGDGRYVFPYNQVTISIYATDADTAARFDAVFNEGEPLAEEVREMLSDLRLNVGVDVQVIEAESDKAFKIVCQRIKTSETKSDAPPSAQRPLASLKLLAGKANKQEHIISTNYVRLGRMDEVIDPGSGLRRRNDISFAESERSVSREHATVRYDARSASFRLSDDNSVSGTVLFRDGRPIRVPKGDRHGVRLQDGDEIHLGAGRLRFEITE